MSRNQNKTISCNSNGIVISYGDANKHQFIRYEKPTALSSYVKKIQLKGTVKYQKIEEQTKFSPKQKDLYSKLLYGFKAYTKEEINAMTESKKINVTINYTKAHRILSRWKQDITFSKLDDLLLFLFPKSPIIKQFVSTKGYINDIPEKDKIFFSEIGINQDAIVNKLIENDLLPKNFYQL